MELVNILTGEKVNVPAIFIKVRKDSSLGWVVETGLEGKPETFNTKFEFIEEKAKAYAKMFYSNMLCIGNYPVNEIEYEGVAK